MIAMLWIFCLFPPVLLNIYYNVVFISFFFAPFPSSLPLLPVSPLLSLLLFTIFSPSSFFYASLLFFLLVRG